MTTISDVCASIYDGVKRIGTLVNNDDDIHGGGHSGLTEQGRVLHRLLRRVEVAISDCEPYLRGVRVWGPLKEVDSVLSALLQTLRDAACKGRLVGYLTADRVLARFSAATSRLDLALAKLQDEARGTSLDSGSNSSFCSLSSSLNSSLSSSLTSSGVIGIEGSNSSSGGGGGAGGTGGLWLPAEAQAELASVRQLLQRARFTLPPMHSDTLVRYRAAAEGLAVNFGVLLEACGRVLQASLQAPLLSKQAFEDALSELQAEVELQQYVAAQLQPELVQPQPRHSCSVPPRPPHPSAAGGALPPGSAAAVAAAATAAAAARAEQDAHYLRVLMDVIRAHHAHPDCDAPLEFLCPLTHRLMQEPVLLHETGHSYERSSLEAWWAAGHRFCPRTGVPLRRLNTSPNHNLRSAVERWRLHCEMQLSFRPVIDTLVAQNLQQQKERRQQEQKQKSAQQSQVVQRQQEDPARSLAQRTVGLAERLKRLAVLEAPPEAAEPVAAAPAAAAAAVNVSLGVGCEGPIQSSSSGPTEQLMQPQLQSRPSHEDQELSAGLLKAAAAAVVAMAAAGAGASPAGAHHAHSWGGVPPLEVVARAATSAGGVPAALLCFSDGGAGAYGCLGAGGMHGGSCGPSDSPHIDTPQRAGSVQLADCDAGAGVAGACDCTGDAATVSCAAAGPHLQAGSGRLVPATVAAAAAGLGPTGSNDCLISFSSVGAAAAAPA